MLEVFCLEGNWQGDDLRARDSLVPLLDLLSWHDEIDYAHRDVATVHEFEHYLGIWGRYPQRQFEFGYFAFHGSKRKALFLDQGALSLHELGRLMRKTRAGEGKIIHIASCYGLLVSEDELEGFLEATGAGVVCGYTEYVDTLRAAAFEILLLHELRGDWTDYHRRFARIANQQADLAEELGFRWRTSL